MIDEDLMKTRPPAILVAAHEPCTNAVTITPPIYFSNYVYTLAATVWEKNLSFHRKNVMDSLTSITHEINQCSTPTN